MTRASKGAPAKRPRGRPEVGERVDLRIPPELLARLDAYVARVGGPKRSEFIRAAIAEMLRRAGA